MITLMLLVSAFFSGGLQVGMRHFHVLRNREHCPIVNLDKLWSMLPEGTIEQTKAAGGKAPVIDVTDSVSKLFFFCRLCTVPYLAPKSPTTAVVAAA